MDKTIYIAELISKHIKGEISENEKQELNQWINENPENKSVFEKAVNTKEQLNKLQVYQLFNKTRVWNNLENELFDTKTIRFSPKKFLRYAAVIMPVLITIGIALYFLNAPEKTTMANIDKVIMPGSQKAVLILSDGGSVELNDESTTSTEIVDGNTTIKNENKALIYKKEKSIFKKAKLIFNELKTPRGGGYNLMLADGSEVWMNAGSSLKFPVEFTDTVRQVFLEGEAYFKVTHTGKPFIVTSGDMDIRVLGTSFNVSAYADEPEIKTTLIEGKVQIELKNEAENNISSILIPNRQAVIERGKTDIQINTVNTSQYTSWMEGKIEFQRESLDIVMKRLSRWYDFNYSFENLEAKDFRFTARIDNKENISSILNMLEMTTNVRFEIKEETIVIQ